MKVTIDSKTAFHRMIQQAIKQLPTCFANLGIRLLKSFGRLAATVLNYIQYGVSAIMGIGAVAAVWIVANLPKSRSGFAAPLHFEAETPATPVWKKDIAETHSMGDLDILKSRATSKRPTALALPVSAIRVTSRTDANRWLDL